MYEQRGIFPNHFSLVKKEYGYKKERPDKTVHGCYSMDSFACGFETRGFAPQWLVRNALRYACGLRSAAHCK